MNILDVLQLAVDHVRLTHLQRYTHHLQFLR